MATPTVLVPILEAQLALITRQQAILGQGGRPACQRRLKDAGYHVERVTGEMLRDDPAGTVAHIAWLRAQRMVQLAG